MEGVPMAPASGSVIYYGNSSSSGKHCTYWFIAQCIIKDTNKKSDEEVPRAGARGSQPQELLFLKC